MIASVVHQDTRFTYDKQLPLLTEDLIGLGFGQGSRLSLRALGRRKTWDQVPVIVNLDGFVASRKRFFRQIALFQSLMSLIDVAASKKLEHSEYVLGSCHPDRGVDRLHLCRKLLQRSAFDPLYWAALPRLCLADSRLAVHRHRFVATDAVSGRGIKFEDSYGRYHPST